MNSLTTYKPLDIYSAAAKYDPTKTTVLRNQFARDMNRRFTALEKAIWNKIVVEDCFLLNPPELTGYAAQFNFPRSAQKVAEFMKWLQEQVNKGILTVSEMAQYGEAIEKAWTNIYITDSYKRGLMRARIELQTAGFEVPSIDATGGINMSMMVPIHADRLGLLYSRVYSDLKGITDAMDAAISRVLTQSMADGNDARLIARKLISTINGSGMGDLGITDTLGRFIPAKRRAEMLARTEIVRAHHQATIQEYKNWGLVNVNVLAEFVTTNDMKVCDICHGLTLGNPYTLDQAMNLIPVHPNCRCVCIPFRVGVDTLIPQ